MGFIGDAVGGVTRGLGLGGGRPQQGFSPMGGGYGGGGGGGGGGKKGGGPAGGGKKGGGNPLGGLFGRGGMLGQGGMLGGLPGMDMARGMMGNLPFGLGGMFGQQQGGGMGGPQQPGFPGGGFSNSYPGQGGGPFGAQAGPMGYQPFVNPITGQTMGFNPHQMGAPSGMGAPAGMGGPPGRLNNPQAGPMLQQAPGQGAGSPGSLRSQSNRLSDYNDPRINR